MRDRFQEHQEQQEHRPGPPTRSRGVPAFHPRRAGADWKFPPTTTILCSWGSRGRLGGGGVHVGHSLHSVLIPHQQEATCAGSSALSTPTGRSGMMSAPQPTHTRTHPPLPRQHAMVGAHPHHGATDLRLRGQLRQDLRKHAVVLRTCPLLLLPPGPAVVELLKRGQVLGGEEGEGARGKQ